MSNDNRKEPNCKCKVCGKGLYEYPSVLKRQKNFFCSSECKDKNSVQKAFECESCGKEFLRYPSDIRKSKRLFCSKECNYEYKRSERYRKLSDKVNSDFKKWLYKEYHDKKKSTTDLSKELYGNGNNSTTVRNWMKKLGVPIRSQSESQTGKLHSMYGVTGNKHHNYNPEISNKERMTKRNYQEYKDFRKKVYERDNYTCQVCSDDTGGNLVCHHLNGYHWDKGGRTEPDNGVTLCEGCHVRFHSIYGNRNNDLFQFSQFKESYK